MELSRLSKLVMVSVLGLSNVKGMTTLTITARRYNFVSVTR